jgi:citrate synthase
MNELIKLRERNKNFLRRVLKSAHEIGVLRSRVKELEQNYDALNYLQSKVEKYEEALRYIAGEGTVYADTLEEARESAITALDDDEEGDY